MAYNPNTGTVTLNGRTYTPGGCDARAAFQTIRHYADTSGFPAGIDRMALLAAVRIAYRLPMDGPAFQIARTVLRGLRAEHAPA